MKADYGQVRVVVVTPVYNTAEFLAECIESVLAQTYTDFDYLIADNASTDDSPAIASSYAERDARIKVLKFEEHLDQLPNFNRALRQLKDRYEYCKLVLADDLIFPTCLEEMVKRGDEDKEIKLIGAYTLLQNRVLLDGLDYGECVLDGREVFRRYLFDGPYIVGNPTACMYRFDQVSGTECFFPRDATFGDMEVAFRCMLNGKLGFVHQVLSLSRVRDGSVSKRTWHFEFDELTRRLAFERYGSEVLSAAEYESVRRRLLWRHKRVLGKAVLRLAGREFWDFHRNALRRIGRDYSFADVAAGTLVECLSVFVNLGSTLRGLWRRRPLAKE